MCQPGEGRVWTGATLPWLWGQDRGTCPPRREPPGHQVPVHNLPRETDAEGPGHAWLSSLTNVANKKNKKIKEGGRGVQEGLGVMLMHVLYHFSTFSQA